MSEPRPTLSPRERGFFTLLRYPGTIVADKTYYIHLLEKQQFQYMFLRPRRWGKSTFLNMLAAYYVINTRDQFDHLFGIGKEPTASRNSHLVLLFDFSSIIPGGSYVDVKQRIFENISVSLRRFLIKYREILGNTYFINTLRLRCL